MTNERAGAIALIGGTLSGILVMLHHPEGIHQGPDAAAMLRLVVIVHVVAIAATPVLTFGMFAVTRYLRDTPAATLAFVFYAFGALAVMVAAAISGYVMPRLIEAEASQDFIRLGWYLNQAFAMIDVGMFAAAMLFYALAWGSKGVMAMVVQVTAFVIGLGVLGWLASGALTLNVLGMTTVIIAQGLWAILAAIVMLTQPR